MVEAGFAPRLVWPTLEPIGLRYYTRHTQVQRDSRTYRDDFWPLENTEAMPCGRVLTQLQPARVHACARTHAHTLYTSCPGNTDTFNDGHSFLSSID